MVLKIGIFFITDFGQFGKDFLIVLRQIIFALFKNAVVDPGAQQILKIVLARIVCSEIRTDRLSLNSDLYFVIFDIRSQRRIKFMCFSASASRWSAASVEENDFDA